jgi:uncharacterized membrane protein YccC
MSATPLAAPSAAPWRQALHTWASSEGLAWIFVAKTTFAAMLALWIAFRLGFDSPRSSMLTVFIVAQPQTGMVLAKSFYRVVGTAVGCLATFVLVGLFAQQRELFLAAIALWVGLCTAGAALYRNFRAYAFVLAGYTTCLIGFPSAMHPEIVFSTAVFRVSEVMLGILCAGLVADLVLPQPLGAGLVAMVRGSYREFLEFVSGALRGRLDHDSMERSHDHFVANVIAFEAQRDAAYFESPDARVRSDRLQLLNSGYMSSTTSIHMLHQMMQRLRRRRCHRALDQLTPLYQALASELIAEDGVMPATAAEAAPLAQRLAAFTAGLPQRIAAARETLERDADRAELLDFDSAADLLQRFAEEMLDYTRSYVALARPGGRAHRPAPPYVAHADWITALLSGVRATVALLSLSVFWIASAWPSGAGAATIACVFCCLFAAAPSPVLALRGISIGFLWGFAAAFVCGLLLLPQLDGFPLLAAAMIPFIMAGVKLLTDPHSAGIGAGYNIMFGSTIGLENLTRFDALPLLNEGFAALLGAVVATLAFALLVPAGNRRLRLHLVRSLRRRTLLACFGRLSGLRHRFENGTRDLLGQMLAGADRASGEDRQLLGRALSVLEAGHAIIDLREASTVGTLSVGSRAALHACVRALAQLFEKPTQQRRQRALEGVERATSRLEAAQTEAGDDPAERAGLKRGRVGLHLLRTLLLDDDTFNTLSAAEHPVAAGVSHAT